MSKILVLLATYNGQAWIADQIDSILGQEGVDVSILAGDDCSIDHTVEYLRYRCNGRIDVMEFGQPAGSAGQNFIRLLRHADLNFYDYVAFSDQDDLWGLDKLSRAVVRMQDEQAVGYSSAVTAFWPNGRKQVLSQRSSPTDLDFLFEGAGQGCTFVLHRDFARQVQAFVLDNPGSLSSIHYHDWMVYAVSRALGKRWVFDPIPSMFYRQHGGNDTGARSALGGVQKRLRLIRSGWYTSQVQQMVALVLKLDPVAIPPDFLTIWNHPRGIQRRLLLTGILLARGRRRVSDRIVLAASSLFGWL